MSAIYTLPLSESNLNSVCTACEQPAIDGQSVAAQTKSISCHGCFNFSCLHYGLLMLHSGNSPSPTQAYLLSAQGRLIFGKYLQTCSFKIHGIWVQANKHTSIHTHIWNAVLLEWGAFRLGPTILYTQVWEKATSLQCAYALLQDMMCSVLLVLPSLL